jgi:hypothetical protein
LASIRTAVASTGSNAARNQVPVGQASSPTLVKSPPVGLIDTVTRSGWYWWKPSK